MKLTSEQRDAVRCDDDVMITACPGSGKTRVIISKLIRVIDSVRDTPRMVGCITYTNAAVFEIEARLRRYSQPSYENLYDICTIHSFCLNHIFRPFCHLIDGYKEGFKVLTPESEDFTDLVAATCERFGRRNLSFPEMEEFAGLRISLEGEPLGAGIEQGHITRDIARQYWKDLQKAGYIDFANIVYLSLLLLRNHRGILDYISAKFAWILVDEFQDTSDLQVELLSLIAERNRTRFFLVGDPMQSIFRFAGARPDLADAFIKRIGARTDFPLSGNFRSSRPIVEHAEVIFSRLPPMESIGAAKKYKEEPRWLHGRSPFEVITEHFLPALDDLAIDQGNAAILAPTWFTLFPLGRHLREYGVNVVGPGARPYRRNRQLAPLAEQVCGYLIDRDPDSIIGIERALFNTILDATGRAHYEIFSYRGRVVVFRLLERGKDIHDSQMGAIEWLDSAAKGFSEILIDEEYLTGAEGKLFAGSVEEMKADMMRNRVDINSLTIEDLGVYASPYAALKLSTLHHAKGREYDAVALIDVHEGRLPSYHATSPGEIEEQKRLFYVGITRPRRFLMYITDDSGRNGPSRFLEEIAESCDVPQLVH